MIEILFINKFFIHIKKKLKEKGNNETFIFLKC